MTKNMRHKRQALLSTWPTRLPQLLKTQSTALITSRQAKKFSKQTVLHVTVMADAVESGQTLLIMHGSTSRRKLYLKTFSTWLKTEARITLPCRLSERTTYFLGSISRM